MTDYGSNGQSSLATTLFQSHIDLMKQHLDLGEFKFGTGSPDFKYFRQKVMTATWDHLAKVFENLLEHGRVTPCDCGASLRSGWTRCPHCAGCGFRDCI